MLVIEGKTRKSLELQEILFEKKSENKLLQILMIDTVGVKHISINGLFQIETSLDTIWATNFIGNHINELRRYDLIVFETNDKKEIIDNYKQLEKLIGRQCIVTIQNNELKSLKVYKV